MAKLIIFYLWLFLLLVMVIGAANIIFSVLSFAPWVPARGRDLKRIFKLAALKPGQIFYDLGCGDGKAVFYAAKNFRVRAIGVEFSFPLYLLCRLKNVFCGSGLARFRFKNLYDENLSAADAVYFFGIPYRINEAFKQKLKREMKPGAKIISYSFAFPDWLPAVTDRPNDKDLPIYLYVL